MDKVVAKKRQRRRSVTAAQSTTLFKPGHSGNPSGKQKTKPFKVALTAVLAEAANIDNLMDAGALRTAVSDLLFASETVDREDVRERIHKSIGDKSALEIIATMLVVRAMLGDMAAVKEIADRIDGKVIQTIAGDEDNPIVSEVRWLIVHSDGRK